MKKNVGSQVIGAQMVSASDGSAFTGAVTIYVTGDGGVQAIGSVGGGACTHEGNGFHSYAPAQAETNYDHVGFTFIGSGAIPATIQVFTTFPQSGDSFTRLGAPTGASIAADIQTVDDLLDTEVAAILADTNELQTDWVNGGRLDLLIDAIKAKTDQLAFSTANRVDAQVFGMEAGAVTAAAVATGAIDADALAADAGNEIADAVLARDIGSGSGAGTLDERTVRSALRFIRNKWSISGATLTVTKEDDASTAWTAAVTTNASADPVTGNDPT